MFMSLRDGQLEPSTFEFDVLRLKVDPASACACRKQQSFILEFCSVNTISVVSGGPYSTFTAFFFYAWTILTFHEFMPTTPVSH